MEIEKNQNQCKQSNDRVRDELWLVLLEIFCGSKIFKFRLGRKCFCFNCLLHSAHICLFSCPCNCPAYRISPSISREISDNFENANLGVRPILGSRKMSSLTTRQATNMLTNFLNNKSLPLLLLCMCSRNS